ncbi:MAG: tetratricopeptide repeat protein, partial [Streptosporangiaceae bacterium]
MIGVAADTRPGHAVAIATAVGGFLRARGHWDQAAAQYQTALGAARRASDRAGQAYALNHLALVQQLTGDYKPAAAGYLRALEVFEQLGSEFDRLGQTWALDELGRLQHLTGDYPAALATLSRALELHRELGSRHGEIVGLNSLGELAAETGDAGQARDHHDRALSIAREIGAPPEEARA